MVTSGFRKVASDRCIGLGHATIYETKRQGGLPNFSHIDAIL